MPFVHITYQRTVTREELLMWRSPENLTEAHRPVKGKGKNFTQVKEVISSTGVIPGILHIATVQTPKGLISTLVDGNNRAECALAIPELDNFKGEISDYGLLSYDSFCDLFLELNGKIAAVTTTDEQRVMAQQMPHYNELVKRYSWMEFTNKKKLDKVSPPQVLTAAHASMMDSPASSNVTHKVNGENPLNGLDWLPDFLDLCQDAWPLTNHTNRKLYNVVNLTMCGWLYHQIVGGKGGPRVTKITTQQFKSCLVMLAGSDEFKASLRKRSLDETSRRLVYNKIKQIFSEQIKLMTGSSTVALPNPEWARKIQSA